MRVLDVCLLFPSLPISSSHGVHFWYWKEGKVLIETDLPNLNKSRDHSELHDIYRRSLAASWAAQAGELPADQCVEDIFNGGDGWKGHNNPDTTSSSTSISNLASEDLHHHRHNRQHSNASTKTIRKPPMRMGHKHSASHETLNRKGESESSGSLSLQGDGSEEGSAREVDEFEVRDDLVAWRLPRTVKTR
jgi:cellulase/cellobiase CelA1